MGDIIRELKDYVDTTPREQKQKDWEELEKYAHTRPVNCIALMVGRFQPFTVTDLENLRRFKEDTGNPVMLMYIRAHQGYANTPFKSATVKKMLEKVKEAYPDLVSMVAWSDKWDATEVFDVLAKHGVCSDCAIESDHNSVKAAITRLALTMDARNEFERCVPECIHDMYDELRTEIKTDRK